MFDVVERNLLKAAVRPLIAGRTPTDENEKLTAAIAQLRVMSPEKFHTEETLASRRFFHQPKGDTPHASFVVPVPSPERKDK